MFGDDRFRGLGVAGGQILAFPIDIDRRPYNTLALRCECVIIYNLRPRAHDRSLPERLTYLTDCNDCIILMLFYQVY